MSKIPFRISPMLATLVAAPFRRAGWIFEENYDGIRMLAYKEGSHLALVSRDDIDRTQRYPQIAQAVQHLKADPLLLDGEIVIFDSRKVSRFHKQLRLSATLSGDGLEAFRLATKRGLEGMIGKDLKNCCKAFGASSSRWFSHARPSPTR